LSTRILTPPITILTPPITIHSNTYAALQEHAQLVEELGAKEVQEQNTEEGWIENGTSVAIVR
jgi:hypothetical protein